MFIQENAFERVVCEKAAICLGHNELTGDLLRCSRTMIPAAW